MVDVIGSPQGNSCGHKIAALDKEGRQKKHCAALNVLQIFMKSLDKERAGEVFGLIIPFLGVDELTSRLCVTRSLNENILSVQSELNSFMQDLQSRQSSLWGQDMQRHDHNSKHKRREDEQTFQEEQGEHNAGELAVRLF